MSNTYDELKHILKTRVRIRWSFIIAYFGFFIIYLPYQIVTDFETFNPTFYTAFALGGGIAMLLVVYLYPYLRPIEIPTVADGKVLDLSEDYTLDYYHEKVEFRIMYLWMVPFRSQIELSRIISTRSTAIKPWRTYMGYTLRVGNDGSIGYITGIKTGVRLEVEGKKRDYVLSTKQPQVLVNYIRSMKQRSEATTSS
ncbi:MAG: hypothetical protein HeimC2_41540 [Candidatus Heimdallarchaeota archaeon LC_2]|nr:MAG: hypothetical protein HeimC2_41540 [Candidatus Heimdallarchaeota archaeon LC_2]